MNILRKLAWVYAAMFLATVLVSHVPSFTDAQGLLFGLYHVSPLIDAVHFISGVIAVIVALKSANWSATYFKFVGIIFGLDVLISLFLSRDLLETFSIFTNFGGSPNFSVTNILANSPHILISCFALWVGFKYSKKVLPQQI